MKTTAKTLAQSVTTITASSQNETQLRHEVENALESACNALSIPWTPFQLDLAVKGSGKTTKFVDVAHGAVVIEYEPPKSFRGSVGHKLRYARKQAEEYAELLAHEEGRSLGEYVLIAWDGAHINFGRFSHSKPNWETPVPFDPAAAERLLSELRNNGVPLVHPKLLSTLVGPESDYGKDLIPLLFDAICKAESATATTKTKLLFTEWQRLFRQVISFQPDAMKALLQRQTVSHDEDYQSNPPAYLFALHTYIALLAKIIAACALPNPSQDVRDASVPTADRIQSLESGDLFEAAGISNMLAGDFFSWYFDDSNWDRFEAPIQSLLSRLAGVDFDVSKKAPETTRDLFKGIYESFIPRALRHALGEFYTPDWLAEHALTTLGWPEDAQLLDPTCGSGTFLLEAVRRRLAKGAPDSAERLLQGIYGIDLNPLAVLAAKGSLAVFVAPYLDAENPIRLPVYLADAIIPATKEGDGFFEHTLQTEFGNKPFRVHERLLRQKDFYKFFARMRVLVDADRSPAEIADVLAAEFPHLHLQGEELGAILQTVTTLVELHQNGWNGIWCSIIAERFAAAAIPTVTFISGNPPWIKWSHLPPDYAQIIKPRFQSYGLFSDDAWVGGIESDISTAVLYVAADRYLAQGGTLGFFITGTVFTTESSEGFRRFVLKSSNIPLGVKSVEDFRAISPFDDVSNHPTLIVVERDKPTTFPVPYRVWSAKDASGRKLRSFSDASSFLGVAEHVDHLAYPIPGGDPGRPWLVGTAHDHTVFEKVFSPALGKPQYQARKGVTTDRNGVFWVHVLDRTSPTTVTIQNAAEIGRTQGIQKKTGLVETEHVYPLLRGRGVSSFCAVPDPDLRMLIPQKGMHGDPNLVLSHPKTYKFLKAFEQVLEGRSSYKRYQKKQGHPFYSLWSTGTYTFSEYKVLWREMAGSSFAAAYVGSIDDPILGKRLVIPDHKLYFIPVQTEDEAAYLTAFLNTPTVAKAVSRYAAALLSLGVSVVEYLNIPSFDKSNARHMSLSTLGKSITGRGDGATAEEMDELDKTVQAILDI